MIIGKFTAAALALSLTTPALAKVDPAPVFTPDPEVIKFGKTSAMCVGAIAMNNKINNAPENMMAAFFHTTNSLTAIGEELFHEETTGIMNAMFTGLNAASVIDINMNNVPNGMGPSYDQVRGQIAATANQCIEFYNASLQKNAPAPN